MIRHDYKCEVCGYIEEFVGARAVSIFFKCPACQKKTVYYRIYSGNIIIPKSFKAV